MTCVQDGDLQFGSWLTYKPIDQMFPDLSPENWDTTVDVIFKQTYRHPGTTVAKPNGEAYILHEHVVIDLSEIFADFGLTTLYDFLVAISAITDGWDITNHLQVDYRWKQPPGTAALAHGRVTYFPEQVLQGKYPSDMARNEGQLHIHEIEKGVTEVWFSKAAIFPDLLGIHYCWLMEVFLTLGAYALSESWVYGRP
jgi:hypothetical protein